jgi:hypothetical protein
VGGTGQVGSGGGGGSTGPGIDNGWSNGGDGGMGSPYIDFDGLGSKCYAGGGNGWGWSNGGGASYCGAGVGTWCSSGTNAVANTGSGGGPGARSSAGGNGADGIVIVRYPISASSTVLLKNDGQTIWKLFVDSLNRLNFFKDGTKATLTSSGQLGLGTNTPTAQLHIAAGTTTAGTAPIKLTSGTSLAIAEAGTLEYTTDDLFFTISTATARKRILLADPITGLTSTHIPFVTTNGRLTSSTNLVFVTDTLTLPKIVSTTSTTTGSIDVTSSINGPHTTTLTDNVATPMFAVTLADGAHTGGTIFYTIKVTGSNGIQTHSGVVSFSANRTGTTYTASILEAAQLEAAALSAGTLADTFSIVAAAGVATIKLNADSDRTAITVEQVVYTVVKNDTNSITYY